MWIYVRKLSFLVPRQRQWRTFMDGFSGLTGHFRIKSELMNCTFGTTLQKLGSIASQIIYLHRTKQQKIADIYVCFEKIRTSNPSFLDVQDCMR
jgi:hypothetical protein